MRVFDQGTHGGAPFYVMGFLPGRSLATRLAESGRLAIDEALAIVDDLLVGAEALAHAGGGPSDFTLAQCFESATADRHPIVLTQTTSKAGRFQFYAVHLADIGAMDGWSAAVAFYELVAGRSPFPVSRRSMMQVWLGKPRPLSDRRADVPPDISLVINELITGSVSMSRSALRTQIAAWRNRGLTQPSVQDRMSIEPPMPVVRVDGSEIIAVGVDAVARYRRGSWSVDPARDVGRVGRIVPIGETDYLALTTDRRLFRLGATGTFKPWGATLSRYAFFGIVPFDDDRDSAFLVGGSTDWGRGMVARLDGESITIVAEDVGVRTLYAATTVADRSHGQAWVGSDRGRILRRRDGHWRRMNRPFAGDPAVMALQVSPTNMRAVLADGTIVLGQQVRARS